MTKWEIFTIVSSSCVGSVAICMLIVTVISRKVYRRSLMASLIALYLRLTVHHKSDEQVTVDIAKLPLVNDIPYQVPTSVRTRSQCIANYDGMTVVCVNMQQDNDTVVLYLHGGGYVRQPRLHHIKYINKLAKQVGNVVAPIYPKAPNHHPDEAFTLLTKLYVDLCKKYTKVVFMGDSSGGGLALALCQHWGEMGLPQPSKTILFSPWVDLTLTNPELDKYQRVDPLISYKSERIWAQSWAQDYDLRDWHVSPMFGPMDKLGKVLLYAGEREILYPDICKLNKIMTQHGVDVRLAVGSGMNHVYQIYPIPEAYKALKEVVEEIRK